MTASVFAIVLTGQAPAEQFHPNWGCLAKPAVQRELRLSPNQVKRIEAIENRASRQLNAFDHELVRKHIRHRVEAPDFAGKPLAQLGESLSIGQKKRLVEITLQEFGAYVYDAPGVGPALALSDKDEARIWKAQGQVIASYELKTRQCVAQHHVPNHLVGGDMMVPVETPEIRKIHAERDAKLKEALKANLTEDQLSRLSKLLGKPFQPNVK